MIYIEIDRKKNIPLVRQVYSQLSKKILSGVLESGEKLPSSRALSEHLEVSRNVILEAYDQLFAEGYITAREGSGTYVSDGTYLENYSVKKLSPKKPIVGLRHEPNENIVDFRTGVPDLSLFPIKKWGSLYKRVCEDISSYNLDYYEPRGCYELRYELSQYLNRSRGVVSSPEQIFITTGAAQAFTLTSRILLGKDKHVIVEDPINNDILKIIRNTGAIVHAIPVDEQGIVTNKLPSDIRASYIFTTPSHQFPTGGILSIKRRIELIHFAEKSEGYVVEDDYDSEYRFAGSPISSLQSLSPERVIYVGTFSKTLYPALRIGYIVLPKELEKRFSKAKHLEDLHSPVLEQITLAKFISEGLLSRHINVSRKAYSEKRNHLEGELIRVFGSGVKIKGNLTGIHLIAKFGEYRFDPSIFDRFLDFGIRLYPIDIHAINKGLYENTLMLGYGNLSKQQISLGVERLYKAVNELAL